MSELLVRQASHATQDVLEMDIVPQQHARRPYNTSHYKKKIPYSRKMKPNSSASFLVLQCNRFFRIHTTRMSKAGRHHVLDAIRIS
jgi:hypothetical protein